METFFYPFWNGTEVSVDLYQLMDLYGLIQLVKPSANS